MSSFRSSAGGSAADAVARCESPSPLVLIPETPSTERSNEEIWKDLNLSFLKDRDRLSAAATTNCFGGFLGDMLYCSFPELSRDKQRRNRRGPSPVSLPFGSPTAAAPPDPVTRLSLSCIPSPPTPLPPCMINKRGSENAAESEDKRKKRLMKNRESADRSRARKQVYRNELENELALLRKENARLRSQEQKIWSTVSTPTDHHRHQPPQKKHKLHRTLTAPF